MATDVEMPRLDGLALTRRIRADGRFAGLPIIALSSLAGEEEIARGMAAGVSEYQVKLEQGRVDWKASARPCGETANVPAA